MDAVRRVGVEHRHNVIMIASVKKGKHKKVVQVIVHGDVIRMENVMIQMEKITIVARMIVKTLHQVVKILAHLNGYRI
jgi:hypothetical protein